MYTKCDFFILLGFFGSQTLFYSCGFLIHLKLAQTHTQTLFRTVTQLGRYVTERKSHLSDIDEPHII